ncbi:hypothetical protein QQF64_011403 [Cirrhinus molitorella]|uniref:CCHC-type domain-containing protein n=1 Tax=Cirrhinus molitorella TaxID=172907 RepID=A0ABR3M274_9TELE
MSSPAEKTDNPSEEQQVRSSSRERSLTTKGQELHEQEARRNEKAFNKAYDSWKHSAKEVRVKTKVFCSAEDLDKIQLTIKSKQAIVHQNYEPIRRNHTTTPDIVKRMDACDTLTAEICDLVSERLENIDEAFNDQLEKERVRIALNKEEYGSVFGNTKTETIISESSKESGHNSSATSRSSSKRADAEAELAAKVEQAKFMQKIHVQQARLDKMESEWKLKETQMLAEIKQKEAEMKLKLELEKTRLQQLQAENEVKVAAARDPGLRIPLNPQAVPFQPHSSPFEVSVIQEEVSLAQAIASSLTLSRLPVPEPTTFTGDPLKFIDWKISFMALIDQKPLPASEKMLYLKSYLAGEARKAVEGFFYRNSEKAYEGAWAVLQDRYGSPFVVQRAFREKLMKWPKIASNDPIALREFADFLQGCVEAILHVKGLSILNDCEENHKLLKKLPEWMMRRWSRIIVEELDRSGEYPSFVHFTEFMQTEARIACNPIASPLLMNMKTTDERLPKRTKALNTSALMKNSTTGTLENSKPKPPCLVCKDETHGVVKCPTFAAKTMDVKKAFIHENHLCFGCLRKGHTTKDCKRRHTCSTCGRRHPTCLHIERNRNPVESTSKDPIATGDHASKEIHKVMTHALTQHVSATSSIVPVLVSSTTGPKKEILTYALLDTQSDSTFILEDLVAQVNVNTQSVQLKLSTMTAVNTVIASKIVCGLQVRGLNSETYAQLQQTYTRDFIPVEKSHIPTKGTALQWPHLKHLVNKLHPLQDCEVGLLIGYDCPSALAPLEVITGDENEPFSQRTMLGWSIIGSANPHLDRQGNESFVHRVAVKEMPVATDVLKVLESDFNERSYEDRYVSQDDVCFIQLLNDNIKQKKDGHFEIPLPFKGSGPKVLPNNKKLATIQLHHLKKKLKANKQYFDHYTTFMEEIIRRGDAEPASPFSEGETVCNTRLTTLQLQHLWKKDFYVDDGLTSVPTVKEAQELIVEAQKLCKDAAPFTLSGKRILQELCRRGIGWDDPIPENLHSRWEEWKNGLLRLKKVTIPRCYHPQNFGKIVRVELHHFSDASNVGYGSCSYLRYKNDKDEVHCSFVMAKARVAPTKITSIPRLELSAAVTAARMSVMLRAELEMKIEQEFFWTDSQVVLAYINNEARRFHVFVANRVQLIREITDPNQWNYVDTAQNPADHASRGLHATDISSASWLSGPKFLWEQEVLPMPRPSTELLACDPEVKSIQVLATQVSDQNSALSRLSRFSTWTTLVKVVARIKRLGSKRKHHGEIVTVEERRRAAEVVIQLVQQQAFSHELKALQSSFHGDVIPSSSPLFHLDPILDDKLLRVGGRLKGSTLSQELKHPIILPKDSHITKLILSHYHAQTCHQGLSQTLMELQANGFWAIGATSHAGGVWERQIRTIRNVLNVTIAQCSGRLDDASLRTLFYEAMAIVNSRPLNVDGINDPMAPEPLTPNHLILMKSKVALPPPGKFVKEDMQKWHVPRRNLKVNDIVILKEDTLPRNQWQLGRVVETREGTDGLVRRVKVQVGERKLTQKQNYCSKPSIIERPIQKLVLLLEDE